MDCADCDTAAGCEGELPLLERFCVEPELLGLDWQGFRARGMTRG
jgi:hypothetical protein